MCESLPSVCHSYYLTSPLGVLAPHPIDFSDLTRKFVNKSKEMMVIDSRLNLSYEAITQRDGVRNFIRKKGKNILAIKKFISIDLIIMSHHDGRRNWIKMKGTSRWYISPKRKLPKESSFVFKTFNWNATFQICGYKI